jgi:guanylate kinase
MDFKKICFVCGVSAAGKSSIIGELLKNEDYISPISITTRQHRVDEILKLGALSKDEFQKLLDNDEMLLSHEYAGNLYGFKKKELQEILRQGKKSHHRNMSAKCN